MTCSNSISYNIKYNDHARIDIYIQTFDSVYCPAIYFVRWKNNAINGIRLKVIRARTKRNSGDAMCSPSAALHLIRYTYFKDSNSPPPHPVYLVYTPLFPLACDFCTTRRRIRVKNIYKWPAYVLYIYASCAFFSVSTGERNNTWCAVSAWNRREAESGGGVLLPSDSVVADKNAHENFT